MQDFRWIRTPLLIGAMGVTALGIYFVVTGSWWLGGGLLLGAFAMERLGAYLHCRPGDKS